MSKTADLAGQREQEWEDFADLEALHSIQREDRGDRIRQDKIDEEPPQEPPARYPEDEIPYMEGS